MIRRNFTMMIGDTRMTCLETLSKDWCVQLSNEAYKCKHVSDRHAECLQHK